MEATLRLVSYIHVQDFGISSGCSGPIRNRSRPEAAQTQLDKKLDNRRYIESFCFEKQFALQIPY
jgi:hypothetical protein